MSAKEHRGHGAGQVGITVIRDRDGLEARRARGKAHRAVEMSPISIGLSPYNQHSSAGFIR